MSESDESDFIDIDDPTTEDGLPINKILHGDARNILPELPDESVQLTVTSPPYNIGKEYGDQYDDEKPIEKWKTLMQDVMEELFRVTKPDGKVCINVGFSTGKTEEEGRFFRIPLNRYIMEFAEEAGFDLYDEFIWVKNTFNSHGGGPLFGSYPYPTNFMANQKHEYILVFRKWVSDSYHKSRELPPTGTPKRENSKLTKEVWREYTQSIWDIEPVRPQELGIDDHAAMFPVELPRRLIRLYSFVEDPILDPFMGAGSTAIAADETNREFLGVELNEKYISHAYQRLTGELPREIRDRDVAEQVKQEAMQNGQEQTTLSDAVTDGGNDNSE